MSNKIYDLVTEKVIAALDAGTVPWRKPWHAPAGGQHASFVSKKPYRGVNQLLLALGGADFEQPWWLTYKQAAELGGQVRRGEHATLITFWKPLKVKDKDEGKTIPLLRYYNVFNVEQVDGLVLPEPPAFDPIEAAQALIDGYPLPPTIRHGGDRAYYSPQLDLVQLPQPAHFEAPGAYYATAFHECAHSTGHESRLNRPDLQSSTFGSDPYAKEELVAELTAAMLCSAAGILDERGLENSAAYIAHWRRKLSEDTRLIVSASAQAQKAADTVRGLAPVREEVAA